MSDDNPIADFEELEAQYARQQDELRADQALRLADLAAQVPADDARHDEFRRKEIHYVRTAVNQWLLSARAVSERKQTIEACLRLAHHPCADVAQYARAIRCACEQYNAMADIAESIGLATRAIDLVRAHAPLAPVLAGGTAADSLDPADRDAAIALGGLYMARAFAHRRNGDLAGACADLDSGVALLHDASSEPTRTMLTLLLTQVAQNLKLLGRFSESREAFEHALQVTPESNAIGRSLITAGLGTLLGVMGDPDSSRVLRESLALRRDTPTPVGTEMPVANSLVRLGNDSILWSRFAEALDYFNQAIAIQERRNDMRAAAIPSLSVAGAAAYLGLPNHRQLARRAAELARQQDDPWLRRTADLLHGEPIDDEVIEAARRDLATASAPQGLIGLSLMVLSGRAMRAGDLARAKRVLGMAARPLTEFDASWLDAGEWAIDDGRRMLLAGEDCTARVRMARRKLDRSPAWRALALGLEARSLIAAIGRDYDGRSDEELVAAARECLAQMESALAERQAEEDLRRSVFVAEATRVREVIDEAASALEQDRTPRLYFGHAWLEFDAEALRRMGSQLSDDARRALERSNPEVSAWLV